MWRRYNAVNFHPNPHKRHPITRPWGRGMGCVMWTLPLMHILPQSLSYHMQNHVMMDRLITAPDCMRHTCFSVDFRIFEAIVTFIFWRISYSILWFKLGFFFQSYFIFLISKISGCICSEILPDMIWVSKYLRIYVIFTILYPYNDLSEHYKPYASKTDISLISLGLVFGDSNHSTSLYIKFALTFQFENIFVWNRIPWVESNINAGTQMKYIKFRFGNMICFHF